MELGGGDGGAAVDLTVMQDGGKSNDIIESDVPAAAMELSLQWRKMLLKITPRRQIVRRSEIVTDAETSLAEYRTGKLSPRSWKIINAGASGA
ncbi:MAG: hypothetical protein M9927_07710 [Anaerolineae bacterium]|nr:hypothetical protein [Anaerolineae bacterium]